MRGPLISGTAARVLPAAMAAGSLAAVLATAGPAAAAGVSTAARGAAAGPQVLCTSEQPGLADRLSKDVAAALSGRQSTTAAALYDRRTGTRCTLAADRSFDSASVVKVAVLGALLRQAMEEQRVFTPRELELTHAMITTSDNDATSALWRQIGTAGIERFLRLAGMDSTVPGTDGKWGLTRTTAGDQLKLLELLTASNPVLDEQARAYALDLMNQVVPGQRWGVPAGAPGTATIAVKNGWLPRSTHAWRVHSMGAFTGRGHDYGIVVLSQDSRTMNYGIETIQGAARAIHQDLTPASPAAGRYVPTVPLRTPAPPVAPDGP
ncbi:serine hydrolase [Streptomyces sp. NPDC004647]|uniref:serine hydrolase n=1 Tax=Streptomyces sp. NPDC004647 TaxID=3154671 RepID=UPI0033B8AC99